MALPDCTGVPWGEYCAPKEPFVSFTTVTGSFIGAPLYDALSVGAIGLKVGQKPTPAQVQDTKRALEKLKWSNPLTPCVIAAWLGGAHDAGAFDFAWTSSGLSAQAACGVDSSMIFGSSIGAKSSVEALAAVAPASSELLLAVGSGVAAQSAAVQNKAAAEDASKALDKAAAAAKDVAGAVGSGLGLASLGAGAILALAVIIAIIIAAKR
jgi:hypothetical protein